ncbi:MAG TPA: PAS domain S-box protein, partial [Deltaproteobacteria bacterium]|nr:PAS domain S-box protein [Deltaproteobacteria bacterium]
MTPIPVTSKDELGILANSFNQMTARLRDSERELKASEEKYRSLFENDPNPIFVVDLETFQIMDVNIRAIETYGYSREEFLSMSFLDLGDEEEAEKIQSLVVHSCIFLPKIRHRKKDGTVLYAVSYTHLGLYDEAASAYQNLLEDIEEADLDSKEKNRLILLVQEKLNKALNKGSTGETELPPTMSQPKDEEVDPVRLFNQG